MSQTMMDDTDDDAMTRSWTILILFTVTLYSGFAWADIPFSKSPQSFTVLVFESPNCEECQPLLEQLQSMQNQVAPQQLTIVRHVLGDPTSQEAFTQHQVTRLPEYLLLNGNQEVMYQMKNRIEPDTLLWEIQEALGMNEKPDLPTSLASQQHTPEASQVLNIILFIGHDPLVNEAFSQTAMQAAKRYLTTIPVITTLDRQQPEVGDWLEKLNLKEAPGYLLLSPSGSVYRKSQGAAKPWQLEADIRAYGERLKEPLETILAELTSSEPDAQSVVPVTTIPSTQPVFDEQSLPSQSAPPF